MGMLKGNSSSLDFNQLMAQATQVAKQQDAELLERARQKFREQEERRKQEARAAREKEAAERERRLQMQQQQQQQKKKAGAGQTKRGSSSKTSEPAERKKNMAVTTKGRNVNSSKRFPAASQPTFSLFPEKKKHVDMSFEELMRTAKEQSLNKASSAAEKPTPSKSRSVEKPRESLYHKQPQRKPAFTPSASNDHQLSVRERAKLMGADVPKRVMNNTKKDKRSISEIQREIRHSRGVHSDDEDSGGRKDSRLMSNKNKQPQRYQHNTSPLPRKKQLSPPRQSQAPVKRSSIPPPSRAAPPAGPRRMPFSGRPLDGRRSGPPPQAMNRRRYREEEEDDEEMDDFVVDDEDEDDGYGTHSRGGYSDEISKIFRYDKTRYADEPAYSDDDMEANASDVLREEKRSERIARREDFIEEQKELERLQKRKKRS